MIRNSLSAGIGFGGNLWVDFPVGGMWILIHVSKEYKEYLAYLLLC